MKIVGVSEGARGNYVGIVTVPTIHSSTASRGNNVVLILGGAVTPGREMFVVPDVGSALARHEGTGTFGILTTRTWTRWAFSPDLLRQLNRIVGSADFLILHSLYSFPVMAGYLLARLYGKPYGVWPHGVLAPFQRTISVGKKHMYNKLLANRIMAEAAVIFYSAEGEREEAAPLNFHTPSVVIPDGFNPQEFAVLPERGRFRARFLGGHKGPLVLFLARLHAKKGLDLLITAMRRVIAARPDARLAIVGPPDPLSFKQQVLQWIHESGIETHTALTGAFGPEMRLQVFADADVYVLPSHAENFGMSVFEAMACGVPVVVSETLNYANEIAQSGAGFAVPRTPEKFCDAIVELINQPELRREIGSRGRLLARKYSLEDTGAKVEATVESILRRRPLPVELAPMGAAGTQS